MKNSRTTYEIALDNAAFKKFLTASVEKPDKDIQWASKCLVKIIDNELKPKQKEFLLEYYVGNKKLEQIALENEINISTVSRAIKKARQTIANRLQYVSPRFMKIMEEYK